ncbi:hypothetical protein D3C72_1657260 [compost metagenome]
MEATTNKVVLHAYHAMPPISCTTDGRMVVTMCTLMACMATAPVKARAVRPCWRPSNWPQLAGACCASAVLPGVDAEEVVVSMDILVDR